MLGRSTPDGYPIKGSAWLNPGQLAQRIELAREMVANAERLMIPTPISTDSSPARRTRFKLNDLRSTPWGQQWLQQNPEMRSMASGEDPQDTLDLWALYLASPQFMYRQWGSCGRLFSAKCCLCSNNMKTTGAVQGVLWPDVSLVAQALERKDVLRLQPAGAYAANMLGLSEQVTAQVVYLTDGPSREVSVGPTQVSLKRTTPKNMACAGRLSGLLIQALRFLGEAHVTPERVAHLRSVEDHFDTA
jgi:hypothetical protein